MLIGIGTDIVEIDRVRGVWLRRGERFSERILCPAERGVCGGLREPWRYLARRWAAKEAIAKCLGTGIGVSLSWQDIEVLNNEQGAPEVRLLGAGLTLARERGGGRVMLSISDERAYAVAFAALLA